MIFFLIKILLKLLYFIKITFQKMLKIKNTILNICPVLSSSFLLLLLFFRDSVATIKRWKRERYTPSEYQQHSHPLHLNNKNSTLRVNKREMFGLWERSTQFSASVLISSQVAEEILQRGRKGGDVLRKINSS